MYAIFFFSSLIFTDIEGRLLFEERRFSPEGKAAELLVDSLLNIEEQLMQQLNRDMGMKITKEVEKTLAKQTHCHICRGPLSTQDRDDLGNPRPNVRDHVLNIDNYRIEFCYINGV